MINLKTTNIFLTFVKAVLQQASETMKINRVLNRVDLQF